MRLFGYSLIYALSALIIPMSSVFAQIDPSDPLYVPVGSGLAGAIEGLYALGVLPVITVSALLFIGMIVYKRFRK